MKFLNIDQIIKLDANNSKMYIKEILKANKNEWLSFAKGIANSVVITQQNIPQFSNMNDATANVVSVILRNGNDGFSFQRIGKYLLPKGKKTGAYTKYGENHSKFASLLGLTLIHEDNKTKRVYVTEFGKAFNSITDNEKKDVVSKLLLLIPYINKIIFLNEEIDIKEDLKKYLSSSTAVRRGSNINTIIKYLREYFVCEEYYYLKRTKK